ncbi:MAG: M23 family metallopeptidase [Candidatus Aminicenantia bacterium]
MIRQNKKIFSLIISFIIFLFVMVFKSEGLEEEQIKVELYYRALHPGEAIMVLLPEKEKISSASIQIFGQVFPLAQPKEDSPFLGLIGIDLDIRPDLYPMILAIKTNQGEEIEITRTLHIVDKHFPVKKIQVDEKYVIPPPEALEKIRRDNELLQSIYRTLTPQWMIDGQFLFPTSGQGRKNFGERRIFNLRPRSSHSGEDILSPSGEDIKAANNGLVVLAEELYFGGKTVILDHGFGFYTIYCHLSEFNVRNGDLVKKGELLGKVGATGRVTGPHLHWGIKLNGSRVDPYSILELPFDALTQKDKDEK